VARIVVLAGGVGAARFLTGLVEAAPQAEITVIGNTGDDFTVHGLHVSPDLDSVSYTLAGIGDEERGWGLRGESWAALGQLGRLGAETWFQLGDLDLATHILRTERLRRGRPLSEVTEGIRQRLDLPVRLLPMSDQVVTTRIHTTDGRDLHIQEYLVREACGPEIASVEFRGAERARPGPGVLEAVRDADLLIVAPSNPVISIGPILAVPGLRTEVEAAPMVVAVSPIVNGKAIKGPAVAMLAALGLPASPAGVAAYYGQLIQLLVLDELDRDLGPEVEADGIRTHVCDTMMVTAAARKRLAESVLGAAGMGEAG
jgi:LPPG:FO 2-phospho-L-lactate transferase